MGHDDIPHTPFTAFGLLERFIRIRASESPLDFTRYDLGVQRLINKYLRVAFDSQAIQYYHSHLCSRGIMFRALESCAVRSRARHSRILSALIQILAHEPYHQAGASIQNARAGPHFRGRLIWTTNCKACAFLKIGPAALLKDLETSQQISRSEIDESLEVPQYP